MFDTFSVSLGHALGPYRDLASLLAGISGHAADQSSLRVEDVQHTPFQADADQLVAAVRADRERLAEGPHDAGVVDVALDLQRRRHQHPRR